MQMSQTLAKLQAAKKQQGFGLVELMIGVAILGIAIALIISQGEGLFGSAKTDGSVRDMESIAMDIKQNFQSTQQNGYTGLTNQVAINQGSTPDYMETGGAVLVNRWGGDVVIDAADLTAAGATNIAGVVGDAIQISFAGIAGDDCASFANGIGGAFDEVEVAPDGDPADATAGTFVAVKAEEDDGTDAATVAGACDSDANTNTVRARLL